MDERELNHSVRKSWELINDMKISGVARLYGSLPISEGFRRLALGGAQNYADLYIAACRLQMYNFMLSDFSIFQFSVTAGSLRYAFLPNPFLKLPEAEEHLSYVNEIVESGESSLEDAIEYLSCVDDMSGVPLIRYEFSVEQYVRFRHPSSHFHIGFHSSNRWPIQRILTPFAFVMLILKLYYGHLWHVDMEPYNAFETKLLNERSASCRPLGLHLFDEMEKQSFHFS